MAAQRQEHIHDLDEYMYITGETETPAGDVV